MKKFLLLLVGVLFFVCNGVAKDWTIYCDTKNNGWEQVYLFYSSTEKISTAYYATGEKIGTSTIFKFTFSTTGDYAKINFSKSNTELKHDGTNGNGDYYTDNKDANWKVYDNYLYVLNASSNGCASLGEYTGTGASTVVYKYSGDETNWADNGGEKELALTDNGDGTYSLIRTFASNMNFGIREYTNGSQTAWYYGVKGSNTISTVGQTYKAVTSDGSNWSFQLTEGEYTLTFNPTAKTIVFTSTSDPKPTVETSYTIYFDAVRSGSDWANPRLTLGGVDVIGTTDGSLIKYVFNAVKGDAITFSNGSAEFAPTLANNTVYYVFNNGISYATKSGYSYSPTHEFTYRVHGQITTGSWTDIPMTYYPDGTWRTAATKFVDGGFGIQKLDKNGNQYKENNSNDYGWIYCSSTTNYTMSSFGVKSKGTIKAGNSGHDWAFAADSDFDATKEYVLVFDPDPKAMTVMFINPAVAATATAEPVAGDGVNTLKVSFDIASYYSGAATKFILSNGSFSAGAKVPEGTTTVSFENVPWSANYTLTPQDGAAIPAAIPVTISAPTITEAEYNESKREWFLVPASENDLKHGMLSLQVTTTGSLYYYLPQAICKVDGEVVESNAFWSENGFTIQIPEFCDLIEGQLPTDFSKTVEITYTPVFPFAVGNASTYGLRAYSGDVQTVLGIASTTSRTITNVNQTVSGVDGLVIEMEDAPVEYFNLQGQRVNGDLAPGIYIRRQGSSVTKVRF